LQSIYPEYRWNFTENYPRDKLPWGYWNHPSNHKEFITRLAKKLNIQHLDEWYAISVDQVRKHGGSSMLAQHRGSLIGVLRKVYPDHPWQRWTYYGPHQVVLHKGVSKSQLTLYKLVQSTFGAAYVILNFKHPDLMHRKTNHRVEYDIFVPHLSMAFEYQGEQHYKDIPLRLMAGLSEIQKQRDIHKEQVSTVNGITLIAIPYWWDKSKESLITTILQIRPDVRYSIP